MKIFLNKLSVFLFIPLLVVVSVNYFGDAANLFKPGYEELIANGLLSGSNVTNISDFDERMIQKKIIQKSNKCPEIIVLGSSTVLLIGGEYYEGAEFHNHGVSGASVEDLIAIMQLYKARNCIPTHVLVGLDPWLLNEENGQNRWTTLSDEFHAFFDNKNGDSWFDYKVGSSKGYQLISPSYFQNSLGSLLSNQGQRGNPSLTTSVNNKTTTRLPDGSLSYGDAYLLATPSDVQEKAAEFVVGDLYSIERFNEMSDEIKANLRELLDFMHKEKVRITVLLPPYHPAVYRFIESSEKHQMVLESQRYFEALQKEYSFDLIGSYNPRDCRLDSSFFYDGMHLNEAGTDILMQKEQIDGQANDHSL